MTLTETVIGLAILSILAGVMTLSSGSVGKQSAKREAERVVKLMNSYIMQGNLTHNVTWFTVLKDSIEVKTGESFDHPVTQEEMSASEGCSYTKMLLVYNWGRNNNPQGYNSDGHSRIEAGDSVSLSAPQTTSYKLTVTGANGKTCDVYIGR